MEYQDVPSAPVIYFDLPVAQGTIGGAIHIELAGRTMCPIPNSSGVVFRMVTTGRLRCSPAAAELLRNSLDQALKLIQQAAAGATGASPTLQ